jgi:uncharacterized protein
MKRRNLQDSINKALRDTPVVMLVGARQTGKTTLARSIVADNPGSVYLSLDDLSTQAAAVADPVGFVGRRDVLTVVDEAHKAPALFVAIKAEVDRDRRPGRFLLTGSASVFFLPAVSDSLAGRVEILELSPFSQGEIEGVREGFLAAVFTEKPERSLSDSFAERPSDAPGLPLIDRVLCGGYPEVTTRPDEERRHAWFSSYVMSILQKDVRDLARIAGLTDMPKLLSLLAARAGGLFSAAEVSREARIPYATLHRYLVLLQTVYLWAPLPAWSTNLIKRIVRAPKVHLCDSGLTAYLYGASQGDLMRRPTLWGSLLETFVVGELRRQAAWSRPRVSLWHYRDSRRREIDILLEDHAGRIVAIEVKAAATVEGRDFASITRIAEDLGPRFCAGIVLYDGVQAIGFGQRLFALPVSALWRLNALPNG